MRKFTKEIASLLATVTVGVSANAFPASSEQFVSFTGEAMNDNVSEETPDKLIQMLLLHTFQQCTEISIHFQDRWHIRQRSG